MAARQSSNGLLATLNKRSKAKTPKFFRKLRLFGLSLTAIGSVLVAAPVVLPVALVALGGYMVVAGGVASAISQITVENEKRFEKPPVKQKQEGL